MALLPVEPAQKLSMKAELVERVRNDGRKIDHLRKCFAVVSMTFVWTSFTLLSRYTRTSSAADQLYLPSTVVVLSEVAKLTFSLMALTASFRFNLTLSADCLREELVNKPKELLKMSVPSLLYAIQNNLEFVALSNLNAAVYQVTSQLKVLTTVLFMVLLLGRRYSLRRWYAIVGLTAGVALVQLDVVSKQQMPVVDGGANESYVKGLTSVFACCVLAGFAGVYFERMLKDGSSTPLWIRNLQMYSWGVVAAALSCALSDGQVLRSRGFFHGYNRNVIVIIALMAGGGISASLVMKYLDNLIKSFAAAVSIILVTVLSMYFFLTPLGLFFMLGSALVCASVMLYNSVNE